MPRPVACPHCGEELDIPAEFRGQEVRCAGCRNVFVTPEERGFEPRSARYADGFDDDLPSRRAERERPSRRDERDNGLDDDLPSRNWQSDDDRGYRDADDFRPARRRRRRPRSSGSTAWIWILLGSVFLFCVAPCGGFFIWAAMLAFPDFQPYNDPGGKFSAQFPGEAKPSSARTEDGLDEHRIEFSRQIPNETYFVRYVDLPRNDRRTPEQILKEAGDQMLADTFGGRDGGRSVMFQDGYRSEHMEIDHGQTGGKTLVRFIVAGRRLYTVGISCEQGIEMHDPRADQFFQGFKIHSVEGPPGK